jgi:hypothetical protein
MSCGVQTNLILSLIRYLSIVERGEEELGGGRIAARANISRFYL